MSDFARTTEPNHFVLNFNRVDTNVRGQLIKSWGYQIESVEYKLLLNWKFHFNHFLSYLESYQTQNKFICDQNI